MNATDIASLPASAARRWERSIRHGFRPLVIRGLARDWPALILWSPAYLAEHSGETPIPVGDTEGGRVIIDEHKGVQIRQSTLREYAALAQDPAGRGYMSVDINLLNPVVRKDFPPPEPCASAPYRWSKLWMGRAGTVTPMHWDLPRNIVVQITGRKRFWLAAPWQAPNVYPLPLKSPFPNFARVRVEEPDFQAWPRMRRLSVWRAELEPGDAIFIPSGWWHEVRNVEPSITLNFFWAEGPLRQCVRAVNWYKKIRGASY
ncbi:MAG: hypothetical protein GMKNLPBB_02731 [Myxococcota bacterium]|nr:hypothetical protein [Myxococcota bacterium]